MQVKKLSEYDDEKKELLNRSRSFIRRLVKAWNEPLAEHFKSAVAPEIAWEVYDKDPIRRVVETMLGAPEAIMDGVVPPNMLKGYMAVTMFGLLSVMRHMKEFDDTGEGCTIAKQAGERIDEPPIELRIVNTGSEPLDKEAVEILAKAIRENRAGMTAVPTVVSQEFTQAMLKLVDRVISVAGNKELTNVEIGRAVRRGVRRFMQEINAKND